MPLYHKFCHLTGLHLFVCHFLTKLLPTVSRHSTSHKSTSVSTAGGINKIFIKLVYESLTTSQ